MSFTYFDYLINNLMMPVFAIAFILVPLFTLITSTLKYYAKNKTFDTTHLPVKILFCVALIALLVIMSGVLRLGGLHLITERPSHAVTITGTIEDVDILSSFEGPKYSTGSEASYGVRFTVNGVQCLSMAKGDFELGDTVSITYMPKSSFVLNMEHIE